MRVWLLAALVLCACTPRDEVIGSDDPPESFGKLASASSRCPDVTGVYAWPFVEGQARGFEENGTYQRNGYAEFFGLSMPERGELEIRALANRKGEGLHFIARPIADAPSRRPQRVQPPTHQRFLDDRIQCRKGWLVIEEYDHPALDAAKEFGSTPRIGAKLAPLANGDLAIGQWLRVTGRHASMFTWGERSLGSRRLPDTVRWYWSRYQRAAAAAGPSPRHPQK